MKRYLRTLAVVCTLTAPISMLVGVSSVVWNRLVKAIDNGDLVVVRTMVPSVIQPTETTNLRGGNKTALTIAQARLKTAPEEKKESLRAIIRYLQLTTKQMNAKKKKSKTSQAGAMTTGVY